MQGYTEHQKQTKIEANQENPLIQINLPKYLVPSMASLFVLLVVSILALSPFPQLWAVKIPGLQAAIETNNESADLQTRPESLSETFSLKPFRIALSGPADRHAQLSIMIEHRNDLSLRKEIAKREVQLREIVLFIVQKNPDVFLFTDHGNEKLRKEIRSSFHSVMRRKIEEVYIMDLLIVDGP